MDSIKNLFDEFKKRIKKTKNKKSAFILALGLIGIMLIGISEMIPDRKEENSDNTEIGFYDVSEKEIRIEERIENSVSKIKGAGKTDVTVMLESSEEYFYAENYSENNNDTDKNNESEYVIIDGIDGEKPLLIKTKEAEIRGVLVICEGGNNPFIKEKIIEAVCALLGISSNKVSVAEMA